MPELIITMSLYGNGWTIECMGVRVRQCVPLLQITRRLYAFTARAVLLCPRSPSYISDTLYSNTGLGRVGKNTLFWYTKLDLLSVPMYTQRVQDTV
jgi:hypothetical protein